MKRLTLAALTLVIASCSKEERLPQPEVQEQPLSCNCGLIISDNVDDYSIKIRNACSGNVKEFRLYEGDWMTAYVGTNYCITNETSW